MFYYCIKFSPGKGIEDKFVMWGNGGIIILTSGTYAYLFLSQTHNQNQFDGFLKLVPDLLMGGCQIDQHYK